MKTSSKVISTNNAVNIGFKNNGRSTFVARGTAVTPESRDQAINLEIHACATQRVLSVILMGV